MQELYKVALVNREELMALVFTFLDENDGDLFVCKAGAGIIEVEPAEVCDCEDEPDE